MTPITVRTNTQDTSTPSTLTAEDTAVDHKKNISPHPGAVQTPGEVAVADTQKTWPVPLITEDMTASTQNTPSVPEAALTIENTAVSSTQNTSSTLQMPRDIFGDYTENMSSFAAAISTAGDTAGNTAGTTQETTREGLVTEIVDEGEIVPQEQEEIADDGENVPQEQEEGVHWWTEWWAKLMNNEPQLPDEPLAELMNTEPQSADEPLWAELTNAEPRSAGEPFS